MMEPYTIEVVDTSDTIDVLYSYQALSPPRRGDYLLRLGDSTRRVRRVEFVISTDRVTGVIVETATAQPSGVEH